MKPSEVGQSYRDQSCNNQPPAIPQNIETIVIRYQPAAASRELHFGARHESGYDTSSLRPQTVSETHYYRLSNSNSLSTRTSPPHYLPILENTTKDTQLAEMYKEMQAFALQMFPETSTPEPESRKTCMKDTLESLEAIKTRYLEKQRRLGPPAPIKPTASYLSGALDELEALAASNDGLLFNTRTELGVKLDSIELQAESEAILAQSVLWLQKRDGR